MNVRSGLLANSEKLLQAPWPPGYNQQRVAARRENLRQRLSALTDKAGHGTVQGLSTAEAEDFFSLSSGPNAAILPLIYRYFGPARKNCRARLRCVSLPPTPPGVYTPIASQWDRSTMESVVPQASCLHRKLDKSRRDACGTCTAAFATEYHQQPSGV